MIEENRKKLDKQERLIVKELIKNPRISDNQISKITKVPIKTVNRKRKKLQKLGLLNYYTYFDTTPNGSQSFGATHMYILTFKEGMSREKFIRQIDQMQITPLMIKHVSFSFLGENKGKLCFIIYISSRTEQDIIEVFNEEIIPFLKRFLGKDIIAQTETLRISSPTSFFHNYFYKINREDGILKSDWPDNKIFVDD